MISEREIKHCFMKNEQTKDSSNTGNAIISGVVGFALGAFVGNSKKKQVDSGGGMSTIINNFQVDADSVLIHDVTKSLSPDYLRLIFHVLPIIVWERRVQRRSIEQNPAMLATSINYFLSSGTNIPAGTGPLLLKRQSITYGLFSDSLISTFSVPDVPHLGGRPQFRIHSAYEGIFFEQLFSYALCFRKGLERFRMMFPAQASFSLETLRYGSFDYKELFILSPIGKAMLKLLDSKTFELHYSPENGSYYFSNNINKEEIEDVLTQFINQN